MTSSQKQAITADKVDELNKQLCREYGRNGLVDGIVNLEKFNNASPRILWILKEGNWGDDSMVEEDHEEFSDEEIADFLSDKGAEKYYNDVTVYNHWRKTFQPISYVSHGLLNDVSCYNDMEDLDENAKIEGDYILGNIAFINVKKNPGSSRANGNLIADSYEKHKEFLHKQIDLISPDIIFNCSGVAQLFTDLAGSAQIVEESGLKAVNTGERISVSAYHPQQTTITQEDYINQCLEAVRSVKGT